jgi:hypothetical protein
MELGFANTASSKKLRDKYRASTTGRTEPSTAALKKSLSEGASQKTLFRAAPKAGQREKRQARQSKAEGFHVIAGNTSQLVTSAMRESFEPQRDRLQGVTILGYDELFNRLQSHSGVARRNGFFFN